MRFYYPLMMAGVGAVMLSAGCSFVRELVGLDIEKPQVTFVNIELKSASPSSFIFDATIEVVNRNTFDISFSHLNYSLSIDGTLVAEGEYEERLEILASQRTRFRMPVEVKVERSLELFMRYFNERKALPAQWQAKAYFLSPLGRWAVSSHGTRHFQ